MLQSLTSGESVDALEIGKKATHGYALMGLR